MFTSRERHPTLMAPVVIETLESRAHRSDSVSQSLITDSWISEFTNYLLFGAVIVGGNGDVYGPTGTAVGDVAGELDGAYIAWDEDLSDGFDSTSVSIRVTADLSGQDTIVWSMTGFDDLEAVDTATDCQEVSKVVIRAGVLGAGRSAAWDSLFAVFYKDGVIEETVDIGTVEANRLNSTGPGELEQRMELTPDSSAGFDKVEITGLFRMQAAQGVYPDYNDMFGDILVFGGNCSN